MRRNLKKLGCAILCTCLLLVNTPGSMSYAGNMEQYATDTDAEYAAYTTYADVPEVEGTDRTATGTDAEDIYTASDTTAGNVEDIYALSVMAADLLLYTESPDVPEGAYSIEINSQDDWDNLVDGTLDDENPIVIILNTDITLTNATDLDFDSKDFLIYGNGDKHSIDINGRAFTLKADTVTIDNVHFKKGTVNVSASDSSKRMSITNCEFSDCPDPCVYSMDEACPVSFSDCNMDTCGRLFKSKNKCGVSFSDITAENCTGTVFGQTIDEDGKPTSDTYLIESISGCKLSTSMPGITAINYSAGDSTLNQFESAAYDFDKMSQIYACEITGFDTGIKLNSCQVVVKDCKIDDCRNGIDTGSARVAIVNTTLTAKSSAADSVGVTAKGGCYLIDCDIKDFDTGSDMHDATSITIIGCRYQNKNTNLNSATNTFVYDTSFIGGKESVIFRGSSYFYSCVVEGASDEKTIGFSPGTSSSSLYIYSLKRPYTDKGISSDYNMLKSYSKRTVNAREDGNSEISNCETGIAATVDIGDTYIHDCETGIKTLGFVTSYGNNVIRACTDGMIANSLTKNNMPAFTEEHKDTICDCLNNGLEIASINTSSSQWADRLEIYNCKNCGIIVKGSLFGPVEIYGCNTGIYMADTATSISIPQFMIYDSGEWNIYNDSTKPYSIAMTGPGTLTGGKIGNVYSKVDDFGAMISCQDLYSDDSVYYLAADNGKYIFQGDNLHGTVFFDADDSGYVIGRRVAGLNNPNIASQMFAKKEGYIISIEIDGVPYAVFAAGCDVTYDVTTNGGDTFDGEKLSDEEIEAGKLKRISYPEGDDIDFSSHDASKDGYEFVGWNTDKDATEGLEPDTLTAGTKDITLYAIYEKTVDISYHTYNADSDYKDVVTFYNNEEEKEHGLTAYNAGENDTFAGYVLAEDATVSSADDLMQAGDDVTVSLDGLDVYCVYEKQGQLKYLKKDGTTLSTESKTVYQISTHTRKFEYTVRAGEKVEGFTFTGWKDEDGNSYATGAKISTEDNDIILTPVYEEAATEGCNVTYDVTTNGGNADSFNGDGTQISYLDGDNVDLTYIASKTGYDFVGWNTARNATEGLTTLTAGTEDITLYAIYKKTVYISYHTYNAALNYRTAVTFYNNQEEKEQGLAAYNAGGDDTFVGYVLDQDANISSADAVMAEGDTVTVSPDGLDVYCVYEKQGQLKYLKKDGTTLSTESKTVYQISTHTRKFEYTVRAGEQVEGFAFTGWKDEDGNSYAAGAKISTENDSVVLTPVYVEAATEGCNVTYDVTTNGGDADSFNGDGTQISYLDGDDVDLAYTASKTGYDFVGWNTARNATEGLTTLTAGTEDITLYAIYKRTAYISYHTYNAALNYRTAVTFYNNQAETEQGLAAYNAGGDDTFVGYVLDQDANVTSADDLMQAGNNVTVSPDGLDVYCVYEKQGQLKYLKKDGTTLSAESKTVYQISTHTRKFEYTVRAGEQVEGFTFTGWKDAAGNSYAAGAKISAEDNDIILTPVYVVKEEPTTEEPTTQEPTTEEPTTETPTTEAPTTEAPTTETPTTEAPTTEAPTTQAPTTEQPTTEKPTTETSTTQTPSGGPNTGDSTTPIGVMGLGILSLLGILVLSLKSKRKN